jgi:CHASE3 domain sensor protein
MWKDILKQDEQAKIDKLKQMLTPEYREINPFVKLSHLEEIKAIVPRLEQAKGTPEFQQLVSTLPPSVQNMASKP